MPGVVFPAISELGVESPERFVYQVGFAVCGACLCVSIVLFEALVAEELLPAKTLGTQQVTAPLTLGIGTVVKFRGLQTTELNGKVGGVEDWDDASGQWTIHLPDGQVKSARPENLQVLFRSAREQAEDLMDRCLWRGHLAATGVVLQGVFTLSRELCPQSFIHWGGAVLFMGGAMQHARVSNELYALAVNRKASIADHRAVRVVHMVRHIIMEYSSMLLFLIPLALQVLPAATSDETIKDSSGKDVDPRMVNAMGLMQWGLIFEFAFYFLTYVVDLFVVVRWRAENKHGKGQR
eukprot:CAMPEP_0194535302 /NCGR_PEP_ID=MMETSP0253-20130528/73795_1 /TAXON_ID=2966 /ORGANISM="Noctiluca scintillans" /LENGTH=293 /DNA_ID=CAMNT_0039381061 /DNA_START=145 /DNA_END=1022 /DNA_ORIENTATION=+